MEHIQALERRLGAYLAYDGCEKTDAHAQALITALQSCNNALIALCFQPVSGEGGGDSG
jgi:hypothetical protein